MDQLSRKQRSLLEYLLENLAINQAVTLEELSTLLGMKARSSIHRLVSALVADGWIVPLDRRRPGIRLTEKALSRKQSLIEAEQGVRYVGTIAAGKPIEAIEDVHYMLIPDEIKTDKPCYVLKVKGDSMIEAGIFDGDWVVIEQRCQARNGEIVVALVDKQDATLKFIEQYPHEVLLVPANSQMTAMRYQPQQVEIQGVLVGQMRRYRH